MIAPAKAPTRRKKDAERVMKCILIDFAPRDRATINQENLLKDKNKVFQKVEILRNAD